MNRIPTDAKTYADFVFQYLLKDLPSAVGSHRAVSETEIPIEGDNWFWADDNAKVLELLSLPEVWRDHAAEVSDILAYLRALCDGPFIFRRVGSPRLDVNKISSSRCEIVHTFMNISCDLAKGLVTLGMRFHDGRTARNVILTGNYVRFNHRGTVYTLDVEDAINHYEIKEDSDSVRLIWSAELYFELKPFRFSRNRLGTLNYACTISAHSMFFDLEASLDLDPKVEVSDVTLTFGFDDISHADNNVNYELVRIVHADGSIVFYSAKGSQDIHLPAEDAKYWCIAQKSQISGFALAVHSLPMTHSSIKAVVGNCKAPNRLHWLVSEHTFPGEHRGASRLLAAEKKIVTSGGFYDQPERYAETFRRLSDSPPSPAPLDFSISYDYGAELYAFARCYRTLIENPSIVNEPEATNDILKSVENLRSVYWTNFIEPFRENASAIFSRSLAFTAFACAEMLIATKEPEYGTWLREACELIMKFERQNEAIDGTMQSGFLMGQEHDSLPYVDCHSSSLSALVIASELLNESVWNESIDRGLAAFRLDTQKIFFLGWQKQDLVGVDYLHAEGRREMLHTFWNFNGGLTLRLFNLLRIAHNEGLKSVWAKHAPRIEHLELLIRDRIAKSIRPRERGVEILSSILSAEANSETQPWVALALIDSAHFALGRLTP